MGQSDVQAHAGGPHFMRTPVGRFHDAGTTPSGNEQALFGLLLRTVGGNHAGKQAGLVVVVGIAHLALGIGQGCCVTAVLGFLQGLLRVFRGREASAAKHDHGVLNTLCDLAQLGFEHFQLHAHATGFAAQQKFRVGKSQSVGIGIQRVALGGVVLQFGPGIGQAAFGDVLGQCFVVIHECIVSEFGGALGGLIRR